MNFSTFFTPFQPIKRFALERPFTTFLSGAILLLAFFFIRQAMTPKIEDTASKKESVPKEISVFEIGKDTPTGTVIGTLDREHVSTIASTASGVIGNISVKEGTRVASGSAIARISPSAASIARSLAEEQLSFTEQSRDTEKQILDLNKKIAESDATTGKKRSLARENKTLGNASLDQKLIASKLNLDIARANESNFTPFAPFAGTIEALYVSEGDLVTVGTPIASIAGNRPRGIIRADIPTALASEMSLSQPHTLKLTSGKTVPVTLAHISESAITPNAFKATFNIADTDAKLIGDASVLEITLTLRNDSQNILIPLSALRTTRDASSVLIDHDGIAEERAVTTGAANGNFIQITGGLDASDHIILTRDIRQGDHVTAKN